MADNTQAVIELIAPTAKAQTAATASGLTIGADFDVRTFLSIGIYVYHANVGTTANNIGVQYKIQTRPSVAATADEDWVTIYTFQTGTTAAVATEIAGNEAAGQTSIDVDVDPTGAFTRAIQCYVQDTTTVADSEWAEVDFSVAVTTVNLVDGLTNAKDAADTIWTQAEVNYSEHSLAHASYIRCIVQHIATTGTNIEFKVEAVELTDFE